MIKGSHGCSSGCHLLSSCLGRKSWRAVAVRPVIDERDGADIGVRHPVVEHDRPDANECARGRCLHLDGRGCSPLQRNGEWGHRAISQGEIMCG